MDRFALMKAFVRIAETGSISAVAQELGATQPTVSKQLAALEAHLGVTLLRRTTRRLALTEAGSAYLESARRILDEVDELESSVAQAGQAPAGSLTVSIPNALGQAMFDDLVVAFQQRHPGLRVHLMESERYVDLIEEGIDVAVRIGRLPDSSLVARKIGLSRRVTVGSPAYFARHGTPQVPEDLARHNCILYTYNATGNTWQYRGRRGEVEVRVSGTFRSTSGHALRRAALAGIGIVNAPVWMVMRELTEGELVPVLPDHEPVPADINAVWPSVRHPGAKVRMFVEYLQETCAQVPLLN